jgi:putative spermidine/putrescine transport system ATP-binding protein
LVPARGGAELAVGSRVDVLVRPESIRIRAAVNGAAVVARASFLGATVRVVATLPDGVEVTSVLPASEGYTFPPGARVDIELMGDVLFVVDRTGVG